MTKPTPKRVRAVEKAVRGTGLKIETEIDLTASKTRFEERTEHGRKVLKMILSKDDAALL